MKKIFYLTIPLIAVNFVFIQSAYSTSPPDCVYDYLSYKDEIYFCHEGREIYLKNVDLDSFEDLGYGYAQDKNAVFFEGVEIEADPETFDALDLYVGVDDKNVHCKGKKLIWTDRDTFSQIDDSHYYRDSNSVFFQCKRLRKSDSDSFQNIGRVYGIDKRNVYYREFILDANRDSFEAIGHLYSKDKSKVFFQGDEIPGADAHTFNTIKIIDGNDRKYCNGTLVLAFDKNSYYASGVRQLDCDLDPLKEEALNNTDDMKLINEIESENANIHYPFNGPLAKFFRKTLKSMEFILGINIF